MILVSPNSAIAEIREKVQLINLRTDKVEVLLSNLLALQDRERELFIVPHEDIVITIETAISILKGDI